MKCNYITENYKSVILGRNKPIKMLNIIENIINSAKFTNLREIFAFNIGKMNFRECFTLQNSLQKLRIENKINDIILFVEHPPVYTITKHTPKTNLLLSKDILKSQGIAVESVDRGGDITFHGPGQIVGYPIINLKNYKQSVRWYIHSLQQVIIEVLKIHGIEGMIDEKRPGVWVENRKIAALGVRISRFVTKHGFALNNNVDMKFFTGIVPCGLENTQVTSIFLEIHKKIETEKLITQIAMAFSKFYKINASLKLLTQSDEIKFK